MTRIFLGVLLALSIIASSSVAVADGSCTSHYNKCVANRSNWVAQGNAVVGKLCETRLSECKRSGSWEAFGGQSVAVTSKR